MGTGWAAHLACREAVKWAQSSTRLETRPQRGADEAFAKLYGADEPFAKLYGAASGSVNGLGVGGAARPRVAAVGVCSTASRQRPALSSPHARERIVGVVFAKDLILVDPSDEICVASILPFCSRAVNAAPANTSLERMLQEMQSSRSHLWVVTQSGADAPPPP